MCQNLNSEMVSDNSELPFFPKFDTEYIFDEKILIAWFEPQFSQSHYNIQSYTSGSNACTLICILMASKCQHYNILINHPQKCMNFQIIHLLALCMLEGNKIHENLKKQNILRHINLTVPEAMEYAKTQTLGMVEWKSLVYMESLCKSLYSNLKANYLDWIKICKHRRPNNLYVVLIADSRTVLFILQEGTDTVTIVDSHQHSSTKGAVMAICRTNRMKHMCEWFTSVHQKYYKSDAKLYELSFLYFKKKENIK